MGLYPAADHVFLQAVYMLLCILPGVGVNGLFLRVMFCSHRHERLCVATLVVMEMETAPARHETRRFVPPPAALGP